MTRTAKLLLILALCPLAAAGILWHKSYAILHQYNWTPLRAPVQIKPGVILQAPLEVDYTGRHLIALDVDRKLPLQQTNCLLGIDPLPREHCAAIKPIVAVKWTLHEGDTLLSSGGFDGTAQESGGHWGPTVGRDLGAFQGTAGTKYTLRVDSAAEAPELNQAAPKIVVAVNPAALKTAVVKGALHQMAALALAGVGALLLLVTALVVVLQRRRAGAAKSATEEVSNA